VYLPIFTGHVTFLKGPPSGRIEGFGWKFECWVLEWWLSLKGARNALACPRAQPSRNQLGNFAKVQIHQSGAKFGPQCYHLLGGISFRGAWDLGTVLRGLGWRLWSGRWLQRTGALLFRLLGWSVVYPWQARLHKEMHGSVTVKLGTFDELNDALERGGLSDTGSYISTGSAQLVERDRSCSCREWRLIHAFTFHFHSHSRLFPKLNSKENWR